MGGKNPMSFGKSKARLITKAESHVTFDDVAGVDEARRGWRARRLSIGP